MPAPQLPLSSPPTTFLSSSTVGSSLFGTSGHDELTAKAGRIALLGGLGDDTYYTFKSSAQQSATNTGIYEDPNGGIDSVFSASSMTIGPYIENLTLTGPGSRYAIGNFGSNAITSGAGHDHLTTGGGDDVLTGGDGRDTYTFTTHANTTAWIADFDSVNDKLILVNHGFQNLAQVQAASEQIGPDLSIALPDGQKVMVANVTAGDLTASNTVIDTPSGVAARQLSFSDEFDGPLSLNTGAPGTENGIWKTSFLVGDRRLYGNHDEQIYVDADFMGWGTVPLGINPFAVEDGILKIMARPTDPAALSALLNVQYTSGMLSSQLSFQQQYGYFEIRADTPAGKGMFPAFWMLPPVHTWPPELDIFEQIGSQPTYVSQGAATLAGPFQNRYTQTGVDMTTGFHTYGLEWTAQKLTWFIDGQVSFQIDTPADMHRPMSLIVTLAVGGSWPGHPDASVDWANADLLIDYIRAYTLEEAPPTLQVMLSNATNPFDLSDSFALPPGTPGTSTTFTAAEMAIAGVAAATSVTATYAANGDLTLVNNAAWNAIKNATITDVAARGVDVRNFVDVEITLGDGDDSVDVTGAKRGTIATGSGDDSINVSATSNDSVNNLIRVLAGAGDDDVALTGGNRNKASLDGGSGNDALMIAGQAVGTIVGGVGDDVLIDFSSGAVTLSGGGGADGFAFIRAGKSTITDYTAALDHIELIGLTPAEVQASIVGADTLLDLGGGATVRLRGVALALADLDLHFLTAPSDPPASDPGGEPPPPPSTGLQVVLSNLTVATNLSDSFVLPPAAANTVAAFTGAEMDIAGVAADVTVTALYGADGALTLINESAWDAIKNAKVTGGAVSGVDVRNFVNVDITMGNSVDVVAVTGVKRGTINTFDGGDRITVTGTEGSNVNNLLTVRAGAEDDTVSYTGGRFNKASLNGETGNDTLTMSGDAEGTISGGDGNDVLRDLTTGLVTLTGGDGADQFAFTAAGRASVLGFVAGTDRVELIGITAGQATASLSGADTLLDLGGGASVTLVGVNLSLAQLNILYT